MSSAYRDTKGWIARFRPLGRMPSRNARKQIRIPARALAGAEDERAAALAYAGECERYCRLLEIDPDPESIRHAARLRAITPRQAEELLTGQRARPEVELFARLRIVDAWDLHPSTRREAQRSPEEYDRHYREIRRFAEWSGLEYVDDIRLEHVSGWIAELRTRGAKYDTRRHHLIALRRATRMAASRGGSDVIGGLVLDERDDVPRETPIPPMEAVRKALSRLSEAGDARMRAAVALSGLMGLRPSEIGRLAVGDVDLDAATLQVGGRRAKNPTSRRLLPLPPTILEWLRPLVGDDPAAPLIGGLIGRRRGAAMERRQLNRAIAEAAGIPQAKLLRKTFTTWAHRRRPRLDSDLVEAWIGHTSSRVGRISARHYMADALLQDLEPIAEAIEALLHPELQKSADR